MRINELFARVYASTDDERRRKRLYDVLRTILRNRHAWGIENSVADVAAHRDFIVSRLATRQQVLALDDIMELIVPDDPPRGLRSAGGPSCWTVVWRTLLFQILLTAALVAAYHHVEGVPRLLHEAAASLGAFVASVR